MFSFRRKKLNVENDQSIKEIENIVQTLDKDGNGRIRIVDLESALQRVDQNIPKPEAKQRVKKFRESIDLFWSIEWKFAVCFQFDR